MARRTPGKNGKGGPKLPKGTSKVQRSALRDVRVATYPERTAIHQAAQAAPRITEQASNRTANIYDALNAQLAPLAGQYQQGAQAISNQFQGDLGNFTSMLGSTVPGVPASEISAGTGLFGTIGAGTMGQLASEQARNLAYQTSAQRQGIEESGVAQRNYQTDLANFLKDLQTRRLDLAAGMPAQVLSREDALRRAAQTQHLERQKFDLAKLQTMMGLRQDRQAFADQQQSDAAASWMYRQLAALIGGG